MLYLFKNLRRGERKKERKVAPRVLMENKIINGLPKVRKTKLYL